MSSGAERAHFLVRTLSGASYRFDAGSSTNYIRQRIAAKSIEAQALNLKEEDVRLYKGSKTYNPMDKRRSHIKQKDTDLPPFPPRWTEEVAVRLGI